MGGAVAAVLLATGCALAFYSRARGRQRPKVLLQSGGGRAVAAAQASAGGKLARGGVPISVRNPLRKAREAGSKR